ncbi:MAG TPA: DUF5719 family protein [Pseudolysinimonas sp.]|nr:DUF5719 family protein [Pseudolysinimonas sp.]
MAEREDSEPTSSVEPVETPTPSVEPIETTDPARPAPPHIRARAARAFVIGARMVTGLAGTAAALVVVGIVGFAPLPTIGTTPAGTTVVPELADQLRACAGGTLRLGEESGQNADVPHPIGVPRVTSGSEHASIQSSPLLDSDAIGGAADSAPRVLKVAPSDGAALTGAQSQTVSALDYVGFSAAACTEPSSSIWFAGGATTVGRTTLLTLDNPTDVAATVRVTILGESGEVVAPGMAGIEVNPGQQRVLSVAGFAPGLASPVIHVEARGGQIAAFLQQSIVRGLDATGVDVVNPGADPATVQTIPGVRIRDAVGVSRTLALADWEDAVSAVRVGVPGTADAHVTVTVKSSDPTIESTSFTTKVSAGSVDELPLDSGTHTETDAISLPDGLYTVTVTSDVPVVAGVRTTTATDVGDSPEGEPEAAPASDFAWYPAVAPLDGDTLIAVAPGPDPKFAVTNPTKEAMTVVLTSRSGNEVSIAVAAGATSSAPVEAGQTYRVTDASGAVAAISYAGTAQLAGYPVTSPRPFSAPLVVRP